MSAGWREQVGALLRGGDVAAAAGLLDRHLRSHPDDVEAWRQWGRVLLALGRAEAAVDAFERAGRLSAEEDEIAYETGVACLAARQWDKAQAALTRVTARRPDHADAHFNLGWFYRQKGENAAAALSFRRAADLRPDWPQAWFNLGNALADDDRLPAAEDALRQAAQLAPMAADVATNLGLVLWRRGNPAAAEAVLSPLMRATPPVSAVTGLAAVLSATGRGDQAVALLRRFTGLGGEVLCALGVTLLHLRRRDEARQWLEQAIALDAGNARAWNALGGAFLGDGELDRAEQAFLRARALKPDDAEIVNNLGNLAASRGDSEAARTLYQQAHGLAPQRADIHSNLLFLLAHRLAPTSPELFAEHCRFGQLQESAVTPLTLPPRRKGERLRVGYVSPDFCNHAVAFWFEGVLASHDRQAFDIHCYHSGVRVDGVTERLRGYGDTWRFIAGLPAAAAAAVVADDDIDILVDLAGHSAGNALPVFALKPARIQATWLGYPFTTGLGRVDYRLTDVHSDPEGVMDACFTEKLVRLSMPPVFRLPADAPPCGESPVSLRGRVRFGSFNKPQKITPDVLDIWARLLNRVENSDLLMMLPGGDSAAQAMRQEFSARGVAADRVVIRDLSDLDGFLEQVRQVDIALDTFPYGGGTTSILTLWMGVPLICLDGLGSASGVGWGMLGAVRLEDLRAADPDRYVAVAAALAADWARLAELRRCLRDRVVESCVTQERQYTRLVEDAYVQWWRDYRRQAGDGAGETP
jgi:protein O-GlcNAc transferase